MKSTKGIYKSQSKLGSRERSSQVGGGNLTHPPHCVTNPGPFFAVFSLNLFRRCRLLELLSLAVFFSLLVAYVFSPSLCAGFFKGGFSNLMCFLRSGLPRSGGVHAWVAEILPFRIWVAAI